jgi:hypothetical protein
VSTIKEIYFIIDPVHGVQGDSVRGSERECINEFVNACYCRVRLDQHLTSLAWEAFKQAGFKVERLEIKEKEVVA